MRISVLLLCASTAASAWSARADDPMPLSGPAVKEGSVPGDAKAFSGGPGRRREGDNPIPHRMFLRALRILQDPATEPAARLTEEQQAKLRENERAFEKEVRAYFEKHRDEIIQAKDTLGLKAEIGNVDDFRRGIEGMRRELELKKLAKKPEGADTMTDEAQKQAEQAAREKLQQLYNGAPKPGDVHTRQWGILTEAQQKIVTDELARLREEDDRDRREFLSRRDTLKQEIEDVIAGKKELDVNDPRLPDKLRERLASMNPDERRAALTRFLADRAKRSQGGAEKKEAPKMDDVQLPPMEDEPAPASK